MQTRCTFDNQRGKKNMEWNMTIATGSVAGSDHRRAGRNNQDASRVVQGDRTCVAIVSDGCGSHADSEVGAKLGVRMLGERLSRLASEEPQTFVDHLLDVFGDTVQGLQQIVAAIGQSPKDLVYESFLFTFVALVSSPDVTACVAIGDGVAFVNEARLPFESFVDNAPPYLGYAVLGEAKRRLARDLKILHVLPTKELRSFLIGTDGVDDLIAAEALTLPGKVELVGPIRQFWEDDRFFQNPDQVRRRLSLINQETIIPDWDLRSLQKIGGRLKDDTTLVVGRRKETDHA